MGLFSKKVQLQQQAQPQAVKPVPTGSQPAMQSVQPPAAITPEQQARAAQLARLSQPQSVQQVQQTTAPQKQVPQPPTPKGQIPPTILDSKVVFTKGLTSAKDIIAPSYMEVDFDHLRIGSRFFRTLFVTGYPRFVGANWLAPIINFEYTLQMSMFYYPVSAHGVLDDIKRKIGEMEATLKTEEEQGKVLDPSIVVALEDAKKLQEQLVKGIERFFQFSFYITIPADSLEELDSITKQVESVLGSLMVVSKHATLQMDEAFQSTLPLCLDKLNITRNMDTTSLATTFPFASSELTSDSGVMYGINEHNGSLVIFDRFNLPNANSVIFAKSGAGKSYLVKLEALRALMFGTHIVVVDPEREYNTLCQAVGGTHIDFSPSSQIKLNPFDLSGISEEGENELGLKILSLHTLLKIMMGGVLSGTEEAILDRALIATYKTKGITQDPATQKSKEPPVMKDLFDILIAMQDPIAKGLADRLERYIQGSLAGIFDKQSNFNISNPFIVFSTQSLEDKLRPIAMYIIMDYIWTRVKKDPRKRILIVDEAWYMMQNPDSATFLYTVAKRARKYFLGVTTITQDVSDFVNTDHGKAIITNSSIQMLFQQSPAAINQLAEIFFLSEGEKRFLLACNVGEGLFFAGTNHVAVQVVASPEEHKLITTKPQEIFQQKKERVAEVMNTIIPPQESKPEAVKEAPVPIATQQSQSLASVFAAKAGTTVPTPPATTNLPPQT